MSSLSFLALTTFLSFTLNASEIHLSSKVKKNHKELISADLELVKQLDFKLPLGNRFQEVIELENEEEFNLDQWIRNRIKYIVEEDFLSHTNVYLFRSLRVIESRVEYPNTQIPYSLTNLAQANDHMTVMSNLGAGVYVMGKMKKIKYQFKIFQKGISKNIFVPLESPRDGIIQIGEGLFHPSNIINPDEPTARANQLQRIATFFHEARHSDGNGKSLAFGHVKCPKGHYLEGALACDENLNGPYTLGGLLINEFIKNCQSDCSTKDRVALRAISLDSLDRVINYRQNGERTKHWSATPESLRQ